MGEVEEQRIDAHMHTEICVHYAHYMNCTGGRTFNYWHIFAQGQGVHPGQFSEGRPFALELSD